MHGLARRGVVRSRSLVMPKVCSSVNLRITAIAPLHLSHDHVTLFTPALRHRPSANNVRRSMAALNPRPSTHLQVAIFH